LLGIRSSSNTEASKGVSTIPYKNNLPLVSIGIMPSGSSNSAGDILSILGNRRKKIVIETHLDFAASQTIVPTYVARELDLPLIGNEEIVTGAGMISMPYYNVCVEFFGTTFDNVFVGCIDFPELTPARALLGRDVLDNYKICLDGKRKTIEVHLEE
jgi:hypothetical protein